MTGELIRLARATYPIDRVVAFTAAAVITYIWRSV